MPLIEAPAGTWRSLVRKRQWRQIVSVFWRLVVSAVRIKGLFQVEVASVWIAVTVSTCLLTRMKRCRFKNALRLQVLLPANKSFCSNDAL